MLLINLLDILDTQCFLLLNKILLNSSLIQYIVGILSHKHESWINVIVMLLLNGIGVFMLPREQRNRAIIIVVYCWLSFQLFLLLNNLFFQKFLYINRDSPSILIPGAAKLSVLLNNNDIKDYSNNSFPAGHTLVLIYWSLFINLYAPKKVIIIAILISTLIIISRIITGAHWLSDTLCSLLLGWLYFKLSIWFANRNERIKYCLH